VFTTRRLRGKSRGAVETICQYFENNRQRMRYDHYLAEGYPIASGVIEGACRHVVKDRMERTGMNWVVAGAQAMLGLRSVYASGQWDDFVDSYCATQTTRVHPPPCVITGIGVVQRRLARIIHHDLATLARIWDERRSYNRVPANGTAT
jgi:hypothetical protein